MALVLTEADVARCLSHAELLPLMRETLGRFSRGEAVQPVRANLAIAPAGGFYGVMPAHLPAPGGGVFGLKSVTFFPDNTGLPTHLAVILLHDGATGALTAIVDGRLITELRTAAVSALSVQLLSRAASRRLAILGAGVQARSHLDAVARVRPIDTVRIWSRTPAHAHRFATDMRRGSPAPITVHETVRETVRGADIVVAATAATAPVLEAAWLAPGAHLCVVGSSDPRRREVDTATVVNSRVFVDSRAGAAVEAGDLLIPAREGAWSLDAIAGELGDVINGTPGRTDADQVTLFKSLGMGVEDVATADLAVRKARALGLGREVALV